MRDLEALLLGALQGATEFLPVSSSGHLVILPALLGWSSNLTFDVIVHWATTMAVLIYFRRDWLDLVSGGWKGLRQGAPWRDPMGARLSWIALATIPALLAGLAIEPRLEMALEGNAVAAARLAALLLLVTGGLLVGGEGLAGREQASTIDIDRLGPGRAMLIGLAQALAILPGISRAGATIATGLALGLGREDSARFSFLLSAPVILGAAILKLVELFGQGLEPGEGRSLTLGFLAAFGVGYLAIGWLLGYLRRASLRAFAMYCWAFGTLSLLWLR